MYDKCDDHRPPHCKRCIYLRVLDWQKANPDKVHSAEQNWYHNNVDKVRENRWDRMSDAELSRILKFHEVKVMQLNDYLKRRICPMRVSGRARYSFGWTLVVGR